MSKTKVSIQVPGMEPVESTVEDLGKDPAVRDAITHAIKNVVKDGMYPIPGKDDFLGDFLEAPDLERVADDLMSEFGEINWLAAYRLRFLWKKSGSKSQGKLVFGKTQVASGLLGFLAEADWIIILAADHCRERQFDRGKIRALLYHELLHCGLKGEDDVPTVVPHDVEAFGAEIQHFGLWTDDLQNFARVLQASLPGFDKA